MLHALRHPYISVSGGSAPSYGGNQNRLESRVLRRCGCGAVAMADLLCYLSRYHGPHVLPQAQEDPIPLRDYDALVTGLQRRYLPTLPPLGATGLSLAAGVTLFMKLHRLPFTAFWGVPQRNFWDVMAGLLDRDIPVVFAIGPSYPLVWQAFKLELYRKTGNVYMPVSHVSAHFITATGLDDHWVRVSSWGKEYYIHRQEYARYARAHSLSLASNLLWLS